MVSVGIYLRTLRDAAQLSQAQAARQAGVATKTVERWEAGSHEPALTTLRPYLSAIKGSMLRVLALLVASNIPDDEVRRYADIDRGQSDLIAKETELTEQLLSLTGERRQAAILMLGQLLAAEEAELAKLPAAGWSRERHRSE